MEKILYTCLFMLFISGNIHAQERIIHGIVTTLDSIPLIGVEIDVRTTGQTVLTDSLGNFSVATDMKDKLKFKANGFYSTTVKVDDKARFLAVNLKLKPGDKQREYAVGYGHVSEEDLTSSITNLNKNDARFARFNDIFDVIRSMGVDVSSGEIRIRGDKSFQGNSAALVVVDGVIVDYDFLKTIKPIYVKSIDIIKDGASAVYGSRGANGVVVIKTLDGK
ncbi:TonB-dependent receptor plug domain-containing protein [Maribellus comscasis]|uniref:TonB-dependent receptor plug domain-containing protein n=1 Tax=Maribellus comscasis TaxID=2681766 RepID=A0A6I6JHD4_9BACT|nr:TonB-dependent receptor plug domain-containing protein [Maribellus comscasis]QGY42206.1 TonB-dependent receptor plug domain-containing protein [Maribellus comscasis]